MTAAMKSYPKGAQIYAAGALTQGLQKVSSGAVILYQLLEDGRRQIVDFAAPGEILHFDFDGELDHFAEALTPVEILVLDPSERISRCWGGNRLRNVSLNF